MSDLEKLTKEELIDQINDLKRDLNNEKYGLYFNRKQNPEEIVLECLKKTPILSHLNNEDIISNGLENILIEGDNYPALVALNTIYPKGLADIIYIDPPYNRGKNDFVYNDKFVDEKDGYKHTKWLNFMERRLLLAKSLLNDNGVIFISIDDHECYQLKLLCDSIFGEKNFINNFMWLHGKGKKDTWSRTLEQYVLAYAKDKDKLGAWNEVSYTNYEFSNPDNDPKGKWFSGSLSFSESRSNPNHPNYYTIVSPTGVKWTRQWQCTKEEMNQYIKDGDISWGDPVTCAGVPRLKIRPSEIDIIPNNIFDDCGTTKSAENELAGILGRKSNFDYPKPVALIKKLCNITDIENPVIMDFFAGSGTTAQAVLELNKEDGGHRKFILCTNNEGNIMTDVCYPRIKTVLTGIRPDGSKYSDGLSGNLRYFKVDFVEDSPYKEQAKYNLADQCDGLLCILESCFDKCSGGKDYNIYLNSRKDKCLSIFNNNYDEKEFDEMLSKVLSSSCKENVVYYFSLDSNVDPNIEKIVKSKLPGADVKPIPSKIYEIYKKIADDVRRKY